MAAEKNFENKIKGFLKDHGCWFLKYWGGAAYTKSGIPDILACCNGKFLGIEVKVSQLQGDRAVITYEGTVVAAVHVSDLTLV